MNTLLVKSYFLGIIRNPFAKYKFDFSGCGKFEFQEGVFEKTSCSADLLNISNVKRRVGFLQGIFDLGTLYFTVNKNGKDTIFELPNIRKSDLLEQILNAHKMELLEEQLAVANMVHLI